MQAVNATLLASSLILIVSACAPERKVAANAEDLSYCDGGNPIIEFFPPPYPEECIAKAVEGRVTAEYDVTRKGRVKNATITESPDDCFNDSLIDAVQSRRYPPMCNAAGEPVARSGVSVSITYRLDAE